MSTREKNGKKMIIWGVILVGLLLVFSLSKGVWELLAVQDRLDQAKSEVENLENKKETLEEKYDYQTSEEYAEKEIRDKLHLAKPEEVIVLLPESEEGETGGEEGIQPEETNLRNWQKWAKLLWGND